MWNGSFLTPSIHTIRVFKNFGARAGYSTFPGSRPPRGCICIPEQRVYIPNINLVNGYVRVLLIQCALLLIQTDGFGSPTIFFWNIIWIRCLSMIYSYFSIRILYPTSIIRKLPMINSVFLNQRSPSHQFPISVDF